MFYNHDSRTLGIMEAHGALFCALLESIFDSWFVYFQQARRTNQSYVNNSFLINTSVGGISPPTLKKNKFVLICAWTGYFKIAQFACSCFCSEIFLVTKYLCVNAVGSSNDVSCISLLTSKISRRKSSCWFGDALHQGYMLPCLPLY